MHEGPISLIEDLEQKHIDFANKWFRYPNNPRCHDKCIQRVRSEFPELTEVQAMNLTTYIVTVTGKKMGLDD